MGFSFVMYWGENWEKAWYPESSVSKLSHENIIVKIFTKPRQIKIPSMDKKILTMDEKIWSMDNSVIHGKNDRWFFLLPWTKNTNKTTDDTHLCSFHLDSSVAEFVIALFFQNMNAQKKIFVVDMENAKIIVGACAGLAGRLRTIVQVLYFSFKYIILIDYQISIQYRNAL